MTGFLILSFDHHKKIVLDWTQTYYEELWTSNCFIFNKSKFKLFQLLNPSKNPKLRTCLARPSEQKFVHWFVYQNQTRYKPTQNTNKPELLLISFPFLFCAYLIQQYWLQNDPAFRQDYSVGFWILRENANFHY